MADKVWDQSGSARNAGFFSVAQRTRLTARKSIATLPRFLRPGLIRESLHLAATVKNRYECIRGLYFRGRAPLKVEFRSGMKWESSRRDSLLFLLEEIVVDRCYTPRWFYKPGAADVVVDLGANIGVFAAHICNLSRGARVACFEPDPSSYRTLAQNVSANQLEERIQVHQMAVWREQGTVYLASPSSASSVGQKIICRAKGAATAVKCITLAQALELADPAGGPIALLKIDTEGAERDILEAADAYTMHRVQRVALEYHSSQSRNRCYELLKSYGLRIRWGTGDADTGICLAWRTYEDSICN